MKKYSRSGKLYICTCVLCKGSKRVSYSTTQRHLKVYGQASTLTGAVYACAD